MEQRSKGKVRTKAGHDIFIRLPSVTGLPAARHRTAKNCTALGNIRTRTAKSTGRLAHWQPCWFFAHRERHIANPSYVPIFEYIREIHVNQRTRTDALRHLIETRKIRD
jgi:hypothetical protein